MAKKSKARKKFRPSRLLIFFVVVTLVLSFQYSESWLTILLSSIGLFFLTSIVLVVLDSKISPDLAKFMAIYLVDDDMESNLGVVRGHLWIGGKAQFISVQLREEGIILLYSGKHYGLLTWDSIWGLKRLPGDGFGAELLLVSNENYDGPKRLIIPWKPDFWQTIPDAKKM